MKRHRWFARLSAVGALVVAVVAVAAVLVMARSDTHACSDIDYVGFRAAREAADRRDDIASRIASCNALARMPRARVRALLGDPSPLDRDPETWRLGAGTMDEDVLIVAYDATDRVRSVQIAWR